MATVQTLFWSPRGKDAEPSPSSHRGDCECLKMLSVAAWYENRGEFSKTRPVRLRDPRGCQMNHTDDKEGRGDHREGQKDLREGQEDPRKDQRGPTGGQGNRSHGQGDLRGQGTLKKDCETLAGRETPGKDWRTTERTRKTPEI
ncbi:hypothetical protein NDU88_005441 [Pleurodeles waltl]|uniref:Uncharacterized protein n=1 Tax=Pleurodeles waltl TaxID=8319 RepID=A0AAV7L7H8_PLEWA|nr:hypothetical protein NDU88_005441 [Pleurodeles waltl]